MSKKKIPDLTEKLNIPAPSLTTQELANKIYEATKDEEKLWRFKWTIKKPEDLKFSLAFLVIFLQNNTHSELVDLILEHSIQNWYIEGWIDLNITKIITSSDDNLLDYAIHGCNYEHFRKLIELNVNYLNCLWSISSWPWKWNNEKIYSKKDVENRKKMLRDLLNLWANLTENFIESLTRNSEVDFFEIIAESESWKKLLTIAFLEKLIETAKFNREYKKDSSMITTIIKLHKRRKVEEILKQQKTKEWIQEIVWIANFEIKQKALSIIESPEFKAEIVDYLLNFYWDELAQKIAEWLRKKLLEDPKTILDLLLPKP